MCIRLYGNNKIEKLLFYHLYIKYVFWTMNTYLPSVLWDLTLSYMESIDEVNQLIKLLDRKGVISADIYALVYPNCEYDFFKYYNKFSKLNSFDFV